MMSEIACELLLGTSTLPNATVVGFAERELDSAAEDDEGGAGAGEGAGVGDGDVAGCTPLPIS